MHSYVVYEKRLNLFLPGKRVRKKKNNQVGFFFFFRIRYDVGKNMYERRWGEGGVF